MALFKTSRMTINRALQMLADDGLVIRRRRSGTFVAPQMAEHSVLELKDIVDEVREKGGLYGYQLLERKLLKTNTSLAPKLAGPVGLDVLHLRCLHFSNRRPLLLEDRYISTKAVPTCLQEDFSETPPGHWLLKNVPWSKAEHIVSALNATEAVAQALDIPAGTACLSVERTTWQDGQGLTYVTLTYPGDQHRLIGSFTPGQ